MGRVVQVKWVLLTALLVVAALSGCAAPGVQKDKAGATGTVDFTGPNATVNRAPVALIRVLSEGLEVPVQSGNVTVTPGNVTLDAGGSTDEDGDELSFSWTVDGKAQASKTPSITVLLAAGNHTARLTLADGKNLTTAALAIVAKVQSAASAGVITYEFTGSVGPGASEAGAEAAPHTFDVPAGAQLITVSAKWDDGVTGNTPLLADVDILLFDPSDAQLDDDEGESFFAFEYMEVEGDNGLAAGTYRVDVLPFAVPVPVDYTVDLLVWMSKPKTVEFTGNEAGVNLGPGGDALTGTVVHTQALPAGLKAVAARLTWTTAGQATPGRVANDYDLYAFAGDEEQFHSGNGAAWEFAFAVPEKGSADLGPAGDWSFEVVPFAVSSADYTLTIHYV